MLSDCWPMLTFMFLWWWIFAHLTVTGGKLNLKEPYSNSCFCLRTGRTQTAIDHLYIDFHVGGNVPSKNKNWNGLVSSRAVPHPPPPTPTPQKAPKCFINYGGSRWNLRYSMQRSSNSNRRQLSQRPTTHCSHYLKPWSLTTPKQQHKPLLYNKWGLLWRHCGL